MPSELGSGPEQAPLIGWPRLPHQPPEPSALGTAEKKVMAQEKARYGERQTIFLQPPANSHALQQEDQASE
ncbi:hypothetical protein EMPG_11207 [Blastomyces silverae]|uniref:Uncharacterized protein n=1 Tax=Blastomyces silverae TaxID=2060906 RepID=A0A0H1BS11_9EURO|nr:hypothetical protein EMPG_11207 [Blastomyces silverae]